MHTFARVCVSVSVFVFMSMRLSLSGRDPSSHKYTTSTSMMMMSSGFVCVCVFVSAWIIHKTHNKLPPPPPCRVLPAIPKKIRPDIGEDNGDDRRVPHFAYVYDNWILSIVKLLLHAFTCTHAPVRISVLISIYFYMGGYLCEAPSYWRGYGRPYLADTRFNDCSTSGWKEVHPYIRCAIYVSSFHQLIGIVVGAVDHKRSLCTRATHKKKHPLKTFALALAHPVAPTCRREIPACRRGMRFWRFLENAPMLLPGFCVLVFISSLMILGDECAAASNLPCCRPASVLHMSCAGKTCTNRAAKSPHEIHSLRYCSTPPGRRSTYPHERACVREQS